MDAYRDRGNSSKYQTSKNQKSFRSNLHGRSNEDEMKSDRDHNDDYYTKKSKNYSDYPMTKYQQQNHGNKSSSDNKSRYDRGGGGSYQQRQGSETRSSQDIEMNRNHRDNRSQEPSSHYKPPIGQTQQSSSNSVRSLNPQIQAALARLPPNIDSLPPRLKKKQLLDAGLPEEFLDKKISDLFPQSYSNNALSIGRNNRNNRYDHQQQNFSYNKYGGNQQQNFDGNHNQRSITPPPTKSSSSRSNATPPKPLPTQSSSSSTSSRYEPIQRRDETLSNNKSVQNSSEQEFSSNFDWSEDVMNTQSLPFEVNANHTNHSGKFDDNNRARQRRRNRSTSSNRSVERMNDNYQNNFKKPYPPKGTGGGGNRQRRNSQSSYNSRENSMERSGYGFGSRENSLDRRHHHRSRYNGRRGSDYQSSRENSTERYGVGNWPRNDSANNIREDESMSWRRNDSTDQKIAALTKDFKNSVELNNRNEQKRLFDPRNPDKPIVVTQSSQPRNRDHHGVDNFINNNNNNNNNLTKPEWMKKSSQQYLNPKLKSNIEELDRLDDELMTIIERSQLLERWMESVAVRKRIEDIFQKILTHEMRFYQTAKVENYMWKILFHRIIEWLRNQIQDCDNETVKQNCKERALEIVDYGTRYYESVINLLEDRYDFKIDDFIGENAASYTRGMGYKSAALVSSQKFFVNLGDLARYREQINQTNNFGRAKNFYVKAQQVVPQNGQPFNQLALLACYSKRKFDAVYFYMRSLMSSNPFEPAKESLCAVFDDIRKKYEVSQRKRDEKNRSKLKEKEHRFDGNLRKETWIHPEGGRRVHRTAPLDPSVDTSNDNGGNCGESSGDEELHNMDPSELNKRFVISFLHVQGKLINKIGMESFQTCATQMLKEFRALLHISPIPVNSHRLLQLISLNMYAIACSEIKDQKSSSSTSEIRSEVQECAIAISLLMFGIILERFIEVLKETSTSSTTSKIEESSNGDATKDDNNIRREEPKKVLTLNEDSKVMLPAIKSWCDWMMFHIKIWNPPPFCSDYKISATNNHDPWNGLATLMTLLETTVDTNKDYLSIIREIDYELVRLQEDVTLAGFTPLKNIVIEPIYCRCDIDIEIAQNALRMQKLKFFGTNFLCDCDRAILKKMENTSSGCVEYVSIVQNRVEINSDSDILIESFSDDETKEEGDEKESSAECNEVDDSDLKSHSEAAEIRRLLRRKDELERKERMMMKYNERLQDILSQRTVALHIEVNPRYLIPDTNCFVDDLISINAIANAHPLYQLMIPITVISELEGLSRGIKPLTSSSGIVVSNNSTAVISSRTIGNRNDPQHAAFVAKASKEALEFLKSSHPAVKCVTAKGSILPKVIFANEDTSTGYKSNDDIILDTALSLCNKCNIDEKKEGEVRYLVREVVLLTTDRNLRVKALTNDIPVRELSDFTKWAGLGSM